MHSAQHSCILHSILAFCAALLHSVQHSCILRRHCTQCSIIQGMHSAQHCTLCSIVARCAGIALRAALSRACIVRSMRPEHTYTYMHIHTHTYTNTHTQALPLHMLLDTVVNLWVVFPQLVSVIPHTYAWKHLTLGQADKGLCFLTWTLFKAISCMHAMQSLVQCESLHGLV